MSNFKLFLGVCLIYTVLLQVQLKKTAIMYRNEMCEDQPPNSPVTMKLRSTFDRTAGTTYHGVLNVGQRFNSFKMVFRVTRCKCREALDTCETFPLRISDACKFVTLDNTTLSPFFKSLRPTFRCPVQQGAYTFANATLDLERFQMFPLDSFDWKVNLRVHVKQDLLLSLCVDTRLVNI